MPDKAVISLVLASGSPRRFELLNQLGFNPSVRVADIDETPLVGETSIQLVERLARLKGLAVERQSDEIVIAADTIISLDGQSLGKPLDKQHGIDMLMALSDRRHEVVTGVCAICGDQVLAATVKTKVAMGPISIAAAEQYWDSGEPADKAGGYAIQGYGAVFVSGIEGSYSNVVGLPLYETSQLIERLSNH